MTSTDQPIAPDQPSDPALFGPLSMEENSILKAHLTSGWYKQSAVYPKLSEPWQETAGLLDDLHDAHRDAFEAQRGRQGRSRGGRAGTGGGAVTSQPATTATGPVQGPAQPTHTDLIWATASSQAALDDASLSPRSA